MKLRINNEVKFYYNGYTAKGIIWEVYDNWYLVKSNGVFYNVPENDIITSNGFALNSIAHDYNNL